MKRLSRQWKIAAGVIVILAVAGILAYRGATSLRVTVATKPDIARITGKELVWEPPPVSKAVDMRELARLASWGERVQRGGGPREIQNLNLEQSWPLVAKVGDLVRGRSFPPADSGGVEGARAVLSRRQPLESGTSHRVQLARYLASQIRRLADAGDRKRCLDASRAGLDLLDATERSPMTNSGDYANSILAQAGIRRAIERGVRTHVYTPAALNEIYNRIGPATDEDAKLKECIRYVWSERIVPIFHGVRTQRDAMEILLAAERLRDPTAFTGESLFGNLDIPDTLRRMAEILKLRLANCDRSWLSQDPTPTMKLHQVFAEVLRPPGFRSKDNWFTRFWETAKFRTRKAADSNSLGKGFVELLVPTDQTDPSFGIRDHQEGLRLLILFEMYRQKHGDRPDTLDDLRPFAGRMPFPRDMFADAPFQYDSGRGVFWGVGKNAFDDGGHPNVFGASDLDEVWVLNRSY